MKEHIIINKDRTVVVPDSVRKIGIQYDHKVNTLTFDCPRYADDNQSIDLSRMAIYINFSRNDKTKGSVAATNIFVDPDNPEIIHFDVAITRSVTLVNGPIICLVCAKSTDAEGVEVNHWNSELFNKLSVGEGLEAEELTEEEIDYVTSLLQEINTTRAEVADMDTRVEDLEFNQEKQGTVSEVDLEAMTWTEGSYITGSGTVGSSSGYGISELVTLPKMSTLILDATGYQSDVAMIAKSDHTPLVTSVDGKTHYEYYTDEEIQVYISCKTTAAKSAKIVRNVAETLSDLERENSELKSDIGQLSEDVTNGVSWNELKDKPFYLEKELVVELTKVDFVMNDERCPFYTSSPKLGWMTSIDKVSFELNIVYNDGDSRVITEESMDVYFETIREEDGREYVYLSDDDYFEICSGPEDSFSITIFSSYENITEIHIALYRKDIKKIPGILVDAPIGKTALTVAGELYDEATDDSIPVIIPQIKIPIESDYVSGSYIFYDTEHRVLRTSEEFMPWNGEHQIRRPNLSPPPLGGKVSVTIAKGDAEWNRFGCDNWKTDKYMNLMFIFNNGTKYLEFFVCIRDGSDRTALCSNASGKIYLLTLNYVDDYTKIIMNIKCIL